VPEIESATRLPPTGDGPMGGPVWDRTTKYAWPAHRAHRRLPEQ